MSTTLRAKKAAVLGRTISRYFLMAFWMRSLSLRVSVMPGAP
jgi:hypothetical protein